MYFCFFFSCDVIAAMMDDISKRCPNNGASSVGTSNMAAMPLSFESLGIGGKPYFKNYYINSALHALTAMNHQALLF